MPAGELRERVAFDRRPTVDDGYGNVEGEWVEQFTVWARVRPLRGSETVIAERLAGVQPATITVRRSSDTAQIAVGWRARDTRTGTVYDITAIANPDERGAYLELMVRAGAGA